MLVPALAVVDTIVGETVEVDPDRAVASVAIVDSGHWLLAL